MKTVEIIGYAISVIAVLPQVVGGILNITKNPIALKNIDSVGYPREFLTFFGISTISLAVLTLLPWTSFLGVILASAWMGGAVAAHVRVKDNFAVQLIIPILIWVGFGLRHQAEMHSLLGF